jgi:A/G-specific adenine glycosylase
MAAKKLKKPLNRPILTKTLLVWFRKSRRDLPWRKKREAYRVWISELMLQQTQVATVIPYFERWLEAFPTVQALAKAPLDSVLKQWEGLGYYRRARFLHQAAQMVDKDGFPDHYQGWLRLPGVGPYTAAAISSIVNNEKVVAVDGNVKRVVSRLFAMPEVTEAIAREKLTPLIASQAGDFNEAMMELGATVCSPKNPKCPKCPIKNSCQAFLQDKVSEFPAIKPKTQLPHYKRYALVYTQHKNIVLHQRNHSEMLNGLWGFILADTKPRGKSLAKVNHAYTHFRLTVTPIVVTTKPNQGQFIKWNDLDTLALSKLDHKILEVLRRKGILLP